VRSPARQHGGFVLITVAQGEVGAAQAVDQERLRQRERDHVEEDGEGEAAVNQAHQEDRPEHIIEDFNQFDGDHRDQVDDAPAPRNLGRPAPHMFADRALLEERQGKPVQVVVEVLLKVQCDPRLDKPPHDLADLGQDIAAKPERDLNAEIDPEQAQAIIRRFVAGKNGIVCQVLGEKQTDFGERLPD
jgi:hypothetical protein